MKEASGDEGVLLDESKYIIHLIRSFKTHLTEWSLPQATPFQWQWRRRVPFG